MILDQCCYFYGSAPHNESNCIPDGQQVQFHCVIHNPRDTFTNLSVRWFRRSNISTPAEDIADIQSAESEYIFLRYNQRISSLRRNCTQGRLYADIFALIINNFNTSKDGYYWCNILVNNSFLEPSQRVRFYAVEGTSCIRQDSYFRSNAPDRAQCASGKPLFVNCFNQSNMMNQLLLHQMIIQKQPQCLLVHQKIILMQ